VAAVYASPLERARETAAPIAKRFGHKVIIERGLIDEYIKLVEESSAMLASNPAKAVELVGLIDQVRGYEGVKLANVGRYRQALSAARQS